VTLADSLAGAVAGEAMPASLTARLRQPFDVFVCAPAASSMARCCGSLQL
jgi:hypothetical protein